jgi:hypothetical protein
LEEDDLVLAKYDAFGSIAHAKMLGKLVYLQMRNRSLVTAGRNYY